jgi:hypothetical protein
MYERDVVGGVTVAIERQSCSPTPSTVNVVVLASTASRRLGPCGPSDATSHGRCSPEEVGATPMDRCSKLLVVLLSLVFAASVASPANAASTGWDPNDVRDVSSNVSVSLSGALRGYFVRRGGGRLAFIWGDFGSVCCARATVTRPSGNVLSVTFDPCSYGYGEEIVMAQGRSLWVTGGVEVEDLTRAVELDHPECG